MKKKIILLQVLFGLLLIESCSDLNEKILDETSTTGLTDKQVADGIIAPAYATFSGLFNHTNYFNIQEISTDEAILPYRGGTDWGDNGIYISMHQHNFASTDPNLKSTWDLILQGVSRSVTAINALPTNSDPSAIIYLAEARGVRAFYSLLTLDLFGIVFVKEKLGTASTILRGNEAVEFIKSELLAIEGSVDNTVGPGRITKSAVQGLLARLHLNAAVYNDRYAGSFDFKSANMDKVIEYCDKIINSAQFQLSADYFAIFGNDNHTNKELIFAVDQRADLNGHNRLAYFSLSGDQFPVPAYPNANGTDGPAITPEFYRTWVDAYAPTDPANIDPRFYKQNLAIYTDPSATCVAGDKFNINRGILRGQQYGLIRQNGVFVKCGDGTYKVDKLFNTTRSNPSLPVNFTEQVNYTVAGSNYSTGYRVEKYEFSKKSVSGRNFGEADISFIRLADIYLMRAEAKLRKGDAAGALVDVNTVRASRTATTPAPPLATLTLDILFRERGFEFYWEMLRRTDMIRFGKYEGTWTEKTNSDKFKRIFPIPQTALDGSSNLPGYLVQNPSY